MLSKKVEYLTTEDVERMSDTKQIAKVLLGCQLNRRLNPSQDADVQAHIKELRSACEARFHMLHRLKKVAQINHDAWANRRKARTK